MNKKSPEGGTNKKYLWMLFPLAILVSFKLITDIDPIVPDSISYMEFNSLRPPLYPLMVQVFGENIITIQDIFWLATGFIILKKTDHWGLIFYSLTIGLLFLSQKMLTETVFVFMITLAAVTKKNTSFLILCLTLLIKPVMILFIPIAYAFLRPGIMMTWIGLILIFASAIFAFNTGNYLVSHYDLDYFRTLGTNCIGKTVGVESLFFQRTTQLQTLCYAMLAVMAAFFYRKNIIYSLPLYLILMSGFAPNQGDRLVIIVAPICLMFLIDRDLVPSIYCDELKKQIK